MLENQCCGKRSKLCTNLIYSGTRVHTGWAKKNGLRSRINIFESNQPFAFSLSGLFSYVVNLANMKFQVDSAKTRDAMNKLRKWTFSDKVQAFHQPRKQLFKSSNRNMFQQQGKSRG